MSRAVPFRTLPCLLLLAALTGCQQSGFKLPRFKGKSAPPSTESAVATSPPAPGRTPEESAFLEKCASLGATGATITGRDGWFFSATELQRLALLSDPASTSVQIATNAIADYRDQLKRQGTELIFVPVPPKSIIFPDKIDKTLKIKLKGKRPPRLDSALQAAYAALRAKGIRVIDPTDALIATRENKKLGPVFPRTAPLWSPRGAETAAQEIAQALKGAKWANQTSKDGPLITEAAFLNYTGPLTAGTAVSESLALRNIGRSADGKMRSVTFSQGGHPLALIGDQTVLAWREANNPAGATNAFASLADQLAYEFQTTPDVFPGKTDGRNAARLRILREATNGSNPLGSAKVVLWVIQATDLALSDWKQVPLRLNFNLSQPPLMLAPPVGLIPDTSSGTPSGPAPAAPAASPTKGDPALPELPR